MWQIKNKVNKVLRLKTPHLADNEKYVSTICVNNISYNNSINTYMQAKAKQRPLLLNDKFK